MTNEVVNLINTVGFHISCVVATGFFIWKTTQQTREDNLSREERTFNQMDKLTDTLDKATDTIDRINIRFNFSWLYFIALCSYNDWVYLHGP